MFLLADRQAHYALAGATIFDELKKGFQNSLDSPVQGREISVVVDVDDLGTLGGTHVPEVVLVGNPSEDISDPKAIPYLATLHPDEERRSHFDYEVAGFGLGKSVQ